MLAQVEGYVEVHIEQYDELERQNSGLGVVDGIAGTTHMLVTMSGDLTYVSTSAALAIAIMTGLFPLC